MHKAFIYLNQTNSDKGQKACYNAWVYMPLLLMKELLGNWVNIYIHLALAFQEIMTKVHRMCNSDNDIVEGMCQIYIEREAYL